MAGLPLSIDTWQFVGTAWALGFLYFLWRGYVSRTSIRGHPSAPHHWFWGHLRAMGEVVQTFPRDIHPQNFMSGMFRMYNLKEYSVLDNWPIPTARKTLIIADPQMAHQVTSAPDGLFAIHPTMREFIGHLVGQQSLILLEGQEWKKIRQIFNPGFTLSNLLPQVDGMVDDCLVFCKVLKEHVKHGKPFAMEDIATRLTFDIIGRVALDIALNTQSKDNELVDAFRSGVRWAPRSGPQIVISRLSPTEKFFRWYHERRMTKYIGRVLDERILAGVDTSKPTARMSVVDRALREFMSESAGKKLNPAERKAFRTIAIDTMKTFLFAGHDTTSSTIAFIYYLLYNHPDVMARVRKEHDDVFGTDLKAVPDLIKREPHLLNQLPYSLAVVKETLRLYPPASTTKIGRKGATMTRPDGTSFSAEDYMVWVLPHVVGRRPDLFPEPDKFLPERFLPPTEYPPPSERVQESVPAGAWRPFGRGPRACIGQELSLLETKMIMVLTLREFDVTPAFDALDAGQEVEGVIKASNPGSIKTAWGERAYQILMATAKPVAGLPSTVRLRVDVDKSN